MSIKATKFSLNKLPECIKYTTHSGVRSWYIKYKNDEDSKWIKVDEAKIKCLFTKEYGGYAEFEIDNDNTLDLSYETIRAWGKFKRIMTEFSEKSVALMSYEFR